MNTRRKTIIENDIMLKTSNNKKYHHLINKVKNTLIKAPYHVRVKTNMIIQIPKTNKVVLFQSFFNEIEAKDKDLQRLEATFNSKKFQNLLKNKNKLSVQEHNKQLNSFLERKFLDRHDIKLFTNFSELKDRGLIIEKITGLNDSYFYLESQFSNYFNEADYSDEMVKFTLTTFKKVRSVMNNVLNVFNDKEKIRELLINQDTLIPRISGDTDTPEMVSLKGEIDNRVNQVYEESNYLQQFNSISDVLPKTLFPKINMFIEIFKNFSLIDNRRDMINWLQNNFKIAKSIFIEINQTTKNTLKEQTLQKILKEEK